MVRENLKQKIARYVGVASIGLASLVGVLGCETPEQEKATMLTLFGMLFQGQAMTAETARQAAAASALSQGTYALGQQQAQLDAAKQGRNEVDVYQTKQEGVTSDNTPTPAKSPKERDEPELFFCDKYEDVDNDNRWSISEVGNRKNIFSPAEEMIALYLELELILDPTKLPSKTLVIKDSKGTIIELIESKGILTEEYDVWQRLVKVGAVPKLGKFPCLYCFRIPPLKNKSANQPHMEEYIAEIELKDRTMTRKFYIKE